MRIAFTNWSNRMVGGAEQYLALVASRLAKMGNEIALWHETSAPEDRPSVDLPPAAAAWNASQIGLAESLSALCAWQPDVTFCQGMLEPSTEIALQAVAPSVFFAHNYHGLCISGGRTLNFPAIRQCSHRFGKRCLLRYFPRRCGGLNPLVMIQEYRKNVGRLSALSQYSAVVSHSKWLTSELQKHGIYSQRIRFFSSLSSSKRTVPESERAKSYWTLLMMGRMSPNKGGDILLAALPAIAARLKRPIQLIMAGDGPSRPAWERQAALLRETPGIDIRFTGWLSGDERIRTMESADLLLLPSLWPEPYGMIGLEAATLCVPTVAFAVGGITDWLKDGVNGALANADPPTASKFAKAVLDCLSDQKRYQSMRQNSRERASQMTVEQHCRDLKQVFEQVTHTGKSKTAVSHSKHDSEHLLARK